MPSPGVDAQAEASARRTQLGYATVFAGFLLFSTSPPLVAGAALGGLAAAFWRAWISVVVFGIAASSRRTLSRHALTHTFAPGISFGLATGLFFEASQRTSVANAALIGSMTPIPMLLAARLLFRERVALPDVGWLALAIGGTTFMAFAADSGGTANLTGDLIAVLSALFSAAYFILGRRARETLDTLPLMVGMMFWAGVVLTPLALLAGQDVITSDASEWVRLTAIALVPGLGHLLINYSHAHVPLVVIGVAQLLMPVSATVLAWWFLDQSVSPGQALGMAAVIGALTAHTVYRSRLPAPA